MKRLLFLFTLPLLLAGATFGQAPPSSHFRIHCVKAHTGKYTEFRSFLMDAAVKVAKKNVESGAYSSFSLSEAVTPAGRAADCDFHLVYISPGPPREPETTTDEDLKKAGIAMTVAQRNARRDQLGYLVSTEYWQMRSFVGTPVKGGYIRLNYFKVKSGELQEWVRTEMAGWQKLAEALAKETPGRAWGISTLRMPGGESQPYNGMTADFVPTWAAQFEGNARDTWMKVHPDRDFAGYMNRISVMADRPMVKTLRLLEAFRK